MAQTFYLLNVVSLVKFTSFKGYLFKLTTIITVMQWYQRLYLHLYGYYQMLLKKLSSLSETMWPKNPAFDSLLHT